MRFAGIRPVLHLPFGPGPSQGVIGAELRALVQRMLAAGVDGLVALGLASEAATLLEHERDEVLSLVSEEVAGRLPLVVGLDGGTPVAVHRARRAAHLGAAGLMVLPPRGASSANQLLRHFAAVADASGLPLLVQDSPQVTGVTLDVPALEALVSHPLLRSLKVEIPGAGPKTSAAHAMGMEIVAGWGGLAYLEQVARGASGCMPGCDLGPALLAIDRAARGGDAAGAAHLYRRILPLLAFETPSLDLLLLSAKRQLRRAGVFSSEALREPGRELDAAESATLDGLLDELAAARVPGFADLGPGGTA
jgi:2-keto-3-deoxy-L-arabinonate dehydratase